MRKRPMTVETLRVIAGAMAMGLLPAGPPARADEINAKSIVIGLQVAPGEPKVPIELRVQTDRASYRPGEVVDILFTITNLGRQGIWHATILHPPLNLRARAGDTTIWVALETPPVDQWPPTPGVGIQAGEFVELRSTWPMEDDLGRPVGPGVYEIQGLFDWAVVPVLDGGTIIGTVESGFLVGVPIEVVPEPTTGMLLFVGYLASLARARRRRSTAGLG